MENKEKSLPSTSINWVPKTMTALSNEEVIYKGVKGAFYHIKYMLEDGSDYLEVATTRPETLFGDTTVAVNPKDERHNKLIGKNVILPTVNKIIPIVCDEHADMEFGTGVVKRTPIGTKLKKILKVKYSLGYSY